MKGRNSKTKSMPDILSRQQFRGQHKKKSLKTTTEYAVRVKIKIPMLISETPFAFLPMEAIVFVS